MDIQEILKRFALIASLSDEEVSPWLPICSEAEEDIRRMLKDPLAEEQNGMRLNAAAAALVYYRYTVYRASGEGMNDFAAGDIKVTIDKKTMVDLAYRVWLDAKALILDLINDNEFLAERVSIV